jgi:RNA-binding protein
MKLSKSQTKFLLSLTHNLKPVVTIGQNGITENVMNEIDIALNFHELVKIKLSAGDRDDRQKMVQLLCEKTKADKIQSIGKTLTLFRRNFEKPKIQF